MRIILVLPYSSLMASEFTPDVYGDGYHVRVAKEIWKRSHKYQLECWRPERKLKQEVKGEKDGIVYRAFPSWRPTLGKLTPLVYEKVVDLYSPLRWSLWQEYSLPMLRALREESKKEDAILHIFQLHFNMSYLICLACGKSIITGRQLGGTPYGYNLVSFLSHLPFSLIEKKALSNVNTVFLGTEWHYEAFKKFYNHNTRVVYPMNECVDFDLFKPMPKAEARKALGIGLDKKVIIHVGRFDRAKGFDAMMDILPELKKHYDIEAICIGGTKSDMLYEKAIDSGVRTLEWIPQQELVRYYSAADVFLFPKFYTKKSEADSERFMGAGVACAEAMGCGLPVVGTNLKGFFATPEEMKGIGLIPKNIEDTVLAIEDVLDNPQRYSGCRAIAEKYYSWEPKVAKMLEVFDELSEKYLWITR